MRALVAIVAFIVLATGDGARAAYPPKGTVLFPGLVGTALQDSIRIRFRPPVGLNYAQARDQMYTTIDNHDGDVVCVYTGFTIHVDPQSSQPRTDAFNAGINAEHTWPQSKGAEVPPMEADLHHLFPSEIDANNRRGNLPFDEIPDTETDTWWINHTNTGTAPALGVRDNYSEYDGTFAGTPYPGRWEPREVHEGNVARAMFYFWTVYRAEANAADPSFFNVQKDALRQWAMVDTADLAEYLRTCAVADLQSGKYNPFVVDPTLIDRAYFNDVPVELLAFTASPNGAAVALAWETRSETGHAGFNVLRVSPGKGSEARRTTRMNERLLTQGPRYTLTDDTGTPGLTYDYYLEAVARDGSVERFGPRSIRFPDEAPGAGRWQLGPNPFRAGGRLTLSGARSSLTSVEIFDSTGRRLPLADGAVLLDGWDGRLDNGRSIRPGIYFVRIRAGNDVAIFRQAIVR
ncbi:MAG TPA: endonuclease [Candidatus Eisenbacteria bacterium]